MPPLPWAALCTRLEIGVFVVAIALDMHNWHFWASYGHLRTVSLALRCLWRIKCRQKMQNAAKKGCNCPVTLLHFVQAEVQQELIINDRLEKQRRVMQHVAAMRQSASSLHQRVAKLNADVHPKMLIKVRFSSHMDCVK